MYANKKVIAGVGIAIVVIIALIFVLQTMSRSKAPAAAINNGQQLGSTTLPGLQATEAPWVAETAHLQERLRAIGQPALSEEGTALHIHQHLDLFVHGKPVAIPAGIGINEVAGFIAPIHIHDTSGIIHVESPVVQTFTLGQFFDIWGVAFDQDTIGGYAADASSTLRTYVNGVEVTGNPRAIELAPHQEIVVTFGTAQELPTTIPSTYTFPAGL